MPLPPGGRLVVSWLDFDTPQHVEAIPMEAPGFVAFEHTYRRPGTYLAVVTTWDVGNRLNAQSGVALWLYPGRSTSLELWRRAYQWPGGVVPAVQAQVAGRDVTLSAA